MKGIYKNQDMLVCEGRGKWSSLPIASSLAVGDERGLWKGDGGGSCPGQYRQGRCELRENGKTLSVPFFWCKMTFHPHEGGLHQVGWTESERWRCQLYCPCWQAIIRSL